MYLFSSDSLWLAVRPEMSSREFGFGFESPGEGGAGFRGNPVSALRELFSQAIARAMLEDREAELLELYRGSGPGVSVRELPDDSILAGSPLQLRLMLQLAGPQRSLGELPDVVRDFLAVVVSGSRVLEDETGYCQVRWVSRGEVADPVFVLTEEQ